MNANMYCDILKQIMMPSLRRLGRWAIFQHDNNPKDTSKMTTALLKKLRVKVICGASSNGRWRSARSLTPTSSVRSSWRSGRGLQWQPVSYTTVHNERLRTVRSHQCAALHYITLMMAILPHKRGLWLILDSIHFVLSHWHSQKI